MSGIQNNGAPGKREQSEREILATTGRQARRGAFGPGGGVGVPVERSDQFGATVRRLGQILGPERARLVVVVLLSVGAVVLVVIGPKLLGEATDIIVSGVSSDDGIDFDALHRKLLTVAVLYAASWVLSYGRRSSSPASCSARCTHCASRSRPRSTAFRSATSTVSRAATC
jgi:ATP-binding cassette subfamily B protein